MIDRSFRLLRSTCYHHSPDVQVDLCSWISLLGQLSSLYAVTMSECVIPWNLVYICVRRGIRIKSDVLLCKSIPTSLIEQRLTSLVIRPCRSDERQKAECSETGKVKLWNSCIHIQSCHICSGIGWRQPIVIHVRRVSSFLRPFRLIIPEAAAWKD